MTMVIMRKILVTMILCFGITLLIDGEKGRIIDRWQNTITKDIIIVIWPSANIERWYDMTKFSGEGPITPETKERLNTKKGKI